MSIFNLFSRKDINEGVVQYRKEDNAVLLDDDIGGILSYKGKIVR